MERTAEVLDAEALKSDIKIWRPTTMLELKVGDIFRLLEPDGTQVTDASGYSVFKAVSAPFVTDNIPGIHVERYFL
jgi:hypothetical protein